MIISPVGHQPPSDHHTEQNSPAALIKRLNPECEQEYFTEPLNEFDKKYVAGVNRQTAWFLPDYFSKKEAAETEMKRIYSPCASLRKIEPNEANRTETSWSTVLAGIRPMGQFAVNTLLLPELHTMICDKEYQAMMALTAGCWF